MDLATPLAYAVLEPKVTVTVEPLYFMVTCWVFASQLTVPPIFSTTERRGSMVLP